MYQIDIEIEIKKERVRERVIERLLLIVLSQRVDANFMWLELGENIKEKLG